MGTEGISLGVKRPEREADHSNPSSAEVKNGGVILSFRHTFSWRGAEFIKHRDSITYVIISVEYPPHISIFIVNHGRIRYRILSSLM
jgi:hypothetical protein